MKKRWLDIPSMSQGNQAEAAESKKWCGRASSSMIYNYYKQIENQTSQYIVNNQTLGDFYYPDNQIAANNYVLTQPLEKALSGWSTKTLFPKNSRTTDIGDEEIKKTLQPVFDTLDKNNPVLFYSGISLGVTKARHIVVISGYCIDKNNILWLQIDDPATMRDTDGANEKSDFLGISNLDILDTGSWNERGCRYWIKARRLFEKNEHSDVQDDLWCDHHDRPGFVVIINATDTASSQYSHFEQTPLFSLPLDLDLGLETTADTIEDLYIHTEQEFPGGYFPVGANTTWHGGVHLLGSDAQPVHAISDGTVVCARMPSSDPEKDRLIYGSRNFVLVRHTHNEKTWYSLYYHLKSIDMSSPDAEKIGWLKGQKLKFKTKVNFRAIPDDKDNEPLSSFQTGEEAQVVSTAESPWYEVMRSDGQAGYCYFKPDWADIIDGIDTELADKFKQGNHVYQIGKTVLAGDILGYIGDGVVAENGAIVKKPIIHWSAFSPELLEGNWIQAQDSDQDFNCDNKTIIDLVESGDSSGNGVFNADGKLTAEEIIAFFKNEDNAKKLRPYACKFRSEWSVDWHAAVDKIKAAGKKPKPSILTLYNFWSDAANADTTLPSNGHVWHYNPIAFVEAMCIPKPQAARAKIMVHAFEPDSYFLLPSSLGIVKAIAEHASSNEIADSLLIMHRSIDGDTQDLTQQRADCLNSFLAGNKDGWAHHFQNNTWADREEQIILQHLKNKNGEPYYGGEIDGISGPKQKGGIRQFQEENNLTVDSVSGPQTWGQMFTVLHEQAGKPELAAAQVVVAQEAHCEDTETLAEVLLWNMNAVPAVTEYENDSKSVYDAWLQAVAINLQSGGAAEEPGKEDLRFDLLVDPNDP
ncbi:MAG: hypothetical protein GF398_07160, partial [Chitinivibrionales bacterium]|nr:hypothetical protein [Chitinivibrionales bacterium]